MENFYLGTECGPTQIFLVLTMSWSSSPLDELIFHLLSSLNEEALTWFYQKLPPKHDVGSCFLYPLPLLHLRVQPLGEHLVSHDLKFVVVGEQTYLVFSLSS